MWVFQIKGSFAELDPILPRLFERGARGLEEREGEVWAYFPEKVALDLEGEWAWLPDEDWLSAWKRDLKPVRAGPFTIRAPWHEAGERDIVIEPGMAFGTGHHETTQLALEALAEAVRPGWRVLDLGTGSGVLAIAAAMLEARVVAVDIDPVAVEAAQKNARANRVAVEIRQGSLGDLEGPFALIVANLYAELHAEFAPAYAGHLAVGGRLIATGILNERRTLVERALEAAGLGVLGRRERGEWTLLLAERR